MYAADLNGAKALLAAAIRNANAAGVPDTLDGIVDSGLHSGARIQFLERALEVHPELAGIFPGVAKPLAKQAEF